MTTKLETLESVLREVIQRLQSEPGPDYADLLLRLGSDAAPPAPEVEEFVLGRPRCGPCSTGDCWACMTSADAGEICECPCPDPLQPREEGP